MLFQGNFTNDGPPELNFPTKKGQEISTSALPPIVGVFVFQFLFPGGSLWAIIFACNCKKEKLLLGFATWGWYNYTVGVKWYLLSSPVLDLISF